MTLSKCTVIGLLTLYGVTALSKSKEYAISAQQYALAPNAGGQEVYSLRLSIDDAREYTIFSNQYLQTGKFPLSGFLYDWRFSICNQGCILQSFLQLGGGISSAGPIAAATWNLTPFWLFRIDFSTHLYFTTQRVIVWNYPFWVGITIPF